MRRKRRNLAGWGVALVAVVAVIAAAIVYTANNSDTATAATEKKGRGLTSEQQRAVLVSISDQPETRFVRGPQTLKQAAAENAFGAPPTMVFKPKSCVSYVEDALGALGSLDGWLQYGSRINPTRNDNFIQVVVTIPGGADRALLDRIAAEAAKCRTGTLTLLGEATGNLSLTETKPLDIEGAETYAIQANSKFPYKEGSREAELVRRFEMPPDAQLLLDDELTGIENSNFVAIGDTLIFVMEADRGLSDSLAKEMFKRVKAELDK
ncbi:hypothetical protein F4553_003432 [Allocatelliglobosispora scoriae]|uniref:PknH-like extracellular domain-containing protein n=1 Tax=Allocatelliglobosispora scoriae TaxID=643052 RepID=A0A841BT03_9ACTN|nr:hypothetical protein [Allocatelliglobosispora scoriae]MBB5870053.1 hypothetical protein [Allocatelliglobosispora scoriae]